MHVLRLLRFIVNDTPRNQQPSLNRSLVVKNKSVIICNLEIKQQRGTFSIYRLSFTIKLNWDTCMASSVNGWQLAKMKKSIPDMSLP